MTPSELKSKVAATGSNYFDRNAMKFFGDTMSNYGCRTAKIRCFGSDFKITTREVWELYRKRPVKNGLQSSVYFEKETYLKVGSGLLYNNLNKEQM
jgi:hypothetical protein